MAERLLGLVAATHTPFDTQGRLALDRVLTQAQHLKTSGVGTVFIGGSTGESHSLQLTERQELAACWREVAATVGLDVVVHVGSNCLLDAQALAAQAEALGARAISALAPSYFKPRSLDDLVTWCREIAAAAPTLPFYFYDIPPLTGVTLPMPEFLERAAPVIPNLAGLKFSNADLLAYQRCLMSHGGRFDLPWGIDEYLLGALALGAQGGVGSSYNFAAPVYRRLIAAFAMGDLESAQHEQRRSVALITLLASYGYLAAAKATMGFLGVDVGAPRLPNGSLTAAQTTSLRSDLEDLGFFTWLTP